MEKTVNSFLDSSLSLRRRGVWEAADSGVLIWRNNFVYFIPFFAVPVWIAACALRLLPRDYTGFSYFILWWLKPFFDRLALHVISLRFFNSSGRGKTRIKDLLRGIFRTLRKGLLGDLLWRRFSAGRAARMPIRVLEGVNRKQFKARKKSLAPGGLNFCRLLSVFFFIMEGVLLFGEIVFGMMICAMFFPSALSYIEEISGAVELFIFAAFCFNYILLESLHVCMGFGLYINSRVEVEGWDMQLLFQKFSSPRGASLKAAQSKKTIPAALLFLALFSAPAAVHAQTGYDLDYEYSLPRENSSPVEYFPQDFPQLSESSFEDLKEILSSKDFGSEEESWGIRLKKRDTERRPPAFTPGPWFNTIRQLFGFLLRFLAVLAVAGILGFGVYWYVKHRGVLFRGKKAGGRSYVNPLLVRESPEALFAKAGDFFARGFVREAWAACLAGCLGVYAGNYSLSFPGDATEYGCLALVQKTLPGKAGKFREVVQDWVLFAYGGRPPAEGAFERALDWGRALGTPGQTARNGSSGETP